LDKMAGNEHDKCSGNRGHLKINLTIGPENLVESRPWKGGVKGKATSFETTQPFGRGEKKGRKHLIEGKKVNKQPPEGSAHAGEAGRRLHGY